LRPKGRLTDAQATKKWQTNDISEAVFREKGRFSPDKGSIGNLDAIALVGYLLG
jgi:hypothetical protein